MNLVCFVYVGFEILFSVANYFRAEKEASVRWPDPVLSYLWADPEARRNCLSSRGRTGKTGQNIKVGKVKVVNI